MLHPGARPLASAEVYDPATDPLTQVGDLRQARSGATATLLRDGRVLVAGSSERPELFDPATGRSALLRVDLGGRWNYLTAMRAGAGALLAGGYREGSIRGSDRVWRLAL